MTTDAAKKTGQMGSDGTLCPVERAVMPVKSATSVLARFLLIEDLVELFDKRWSLWNMSLFGAINTAVSGLSSQSTSFGNISEDVANSQTVGFKRVDTSFVDYLTTSTATNNEPGAVVAHPSYVNNIQGAI